MSVEYKDYYKLLDVSRSATKEEISKSYKKLAKKLHPDLNPGDKKAESQFKDITEAYEVLKDPEKRKLYDQLGSNWQHGQNFQRPQGFAGANSFRFNRGGGGTENADFSDFFANIFGGTGGAGGMGGFDQDSFGGFGQQRKRRGRDVESQLALTLEEAYVGGHKNITLQNQGESGNTVRVNIPAGIREGSRIRLAGKGESGSGGAGDLFLRIAFLPHPQFSIDENNIIHDLYLAPWEAVLGTKLRVPTLEGEVQLSIQPGSNSGKKLRLRGKGLGSGKEKGDQFVRLNIRVPEELSPEEKELWEKLQQVSSFTARY